VLFTLLEPCLLLALLLVLELLDILLHLRKCSPLLCVLLCLLLLGL
jgi:hypothetical protein